MQTNAMDPVGARVTGLDLRHADEQTAAALTALVAEHGVLIIPEQDIDDVQFLAFLQSLGEMTFTKGETPVDGFPDLNVISNVGRDTPPKSNWHVDTSYVARVPALTALRTVQVPRAGGQTLFTNQYRSYETLPAELRDELAGRTITHAVTGVELDDDDETQAEHEIFRTHPVSGRTAVYISTPARCVAVSGMGAEESSSVVSQLFEHSTRPENVLRHSWTAGDVVIWDNRCVLHKADHEGVVGDRVMHRGMVLEPAP